MAGAAAAAALGGKSGLGDVICEMAVRPATPRDGGK